eukprot:UN09299
MILIDPDNFQFWPKMLKIIFFCQNSQNHPFLPISSKVYLV